MIILSISTDSYNVLIYVNPYIIFLDFDYKNIFTFTKGLKQ
jgi:hypothetical protein